MIKMPSDLSLFSTCSDQHLAWPLFPSPGSVHSARVEISGIQVSGDIIVTYIIVMIIGQIQAVFNC